MPPDKILQSGSLARRIKRDSGLKDYRSADGQAQAALAAQCIWSRCPLLPAAYSRFPCHATPFTLLPGCLPLLPVSHNNLLLAQRHGDFPANLPGHLGVHEGLGAGDDANGHQFARDFLDTQHFRPVNDELRDR